MSVQLHYKDGKLDRVDLHSVKQIRTQDCRGSDSSFVGIEAVEESTTVYWFLNPDQAEQVYQQLKEMFFDADDTPDLADIAKQTAIDGANAVARFVGGPE